MGDPKKPRKKYVTPRYRWRTSILQEELKLLGQYGLRNKRELWRHKTVLSKFRGTARSLIGRSSEERKKIEGELLARLKKLGLISETAVLGDVLDLTLEDVLERRLQTVVFRKGLAKSIYQSRQLINHRHIAIGKQQITIPGYMVARDEEKQITYAAQSPFSIPNHPLRQTIEIVT